VYSSPIQATQGMHEEPLLHDTTQAYCFTKHDYHLVEFKNKDFVSRLKTA
jgi:hypothetical protein